VKYRVLCATGEKFRIANGLKNKDLRHFRSLLPLVDIVEVAGSNPVPPTHHKSCRIKHFCYLPTVGSAARFQGAKRYIPFWCFNNGESHMPRLSHSVPKYRKHRASGQAVVTIAGQDRYLGPYGTKVSKFEYDRLVQEWLVAGRSTVPTAEAEPLTITELISRYWEFARTASPLVQRTTSSRSCGYCGAPTATRS
jgi:hypothetical protein